MNNAIGVLASALVLLVSVPASALPVVVISTGVRASAARPEKGASSGEPLFEPIEILTSALRDGEKDVQWQRQRVHTYVDIPDFDRLPLTLSGLWRIRIAGRGDGRRDIDTARSALQCEVNR
jgi:hypothetical protein